MRRECSSESTSIVIDQGSAMVKAGFSGDDAPRATFPPRVGRPRDDDCHRRCVSKDTYVGDEAYVKSEVLPQTKPGDINWDNMEKIWFHVFYNELRVAPEDHSVLITEVPMNRKTNRTQTAKIMFETFGVTGFYTKISAVLAAIAAGRTSGVVLDSGHTASYSIPVYELCAINHAIEKSVIAGKAMTSYLAGLLNSRGYAFTTTEEMDFVQRIKEGSIGQCNVERQSFGASSQENVENFELPDGRVITLGSEKQQCLDGLFTPTLVDKKVKLGAHELVNSSVMKCDEDLRRDLIGNVVITGGNSLLKGFPDRLKANLEGTFDDMKINVVASDDRKYGAWIGGSILASLSMFDTMLVSKDEYEEWGPNIVHRKCF